MSQPSSGDPSISDRKEKITQQSIEREISDNDESLLYSSGLIVSTVTTTELVDDTGITSRHELPNSYVSTEKRPKKKNNNGFFDSLFNGLCSSSRHINNQVVPSDHQTSKPRVTHSNKSTFFHLTQLPKPKDIVDFVSSIQIEFVSEQEESTIFGNNSRNNGLFLVKYSDIETSSKKVYPQTPFRAYMSRTISKESYSVNSAATTAKDFEMLTAMIDIVTIFLENLRKSGDGFFSTKVSFDENFVSLEGCLALTVSVLIYIYLYHCIYMYIYKLLVYICR